MTPVPDPWERQPSDTAESWPAFVAYRDQIPPRRIEQACASGVGRPVSVDQVRRWYIDHDWAFRVEAWDSVLDSIRQDEIKAATRVNGEAVGARLSSLLSAAEALVASELRKLEILSASVDGASLKPGDLSKLLDMVVKYRRLIAGQTTENVGVAFDLSKLTDTELATFRTLLQKAGGSL